MIFRRFFRFFFDLLANQLSIGNFVSGSAYNQYFDNISVEKTGILFLAYTYKKHFIRVERDYKDDKSYHKTLLYF